MRRLIIASGRVLLLLASLFSPFAAAEHPVEVVTADFPPLTTDVEGKPGGVALEILQEACNRAGIPLEFNFLPWQRAQWEVQTRNDVLIIPFTRMPSREASYQWIAPLLEFKTVLITLAAPPTSLDAARQLKVGYVRGTSFKDEAERAGFTHVEETNDDETNARKLKIKHIDAWITMDLMADSVYREAGFDPSELKYGPILGPVKISYVAAAPGFPKETAEKITRAVNQMKADGSLQAIIKRYR